MLDKTLRLVSALGLLTGCSLMVADQTQCQSSSDCTEPAVCVGGLCVKPPDAGETDAGVDAGPLDGGSDAGMAVVGFSVTGGATPTAGQIAAVTVTAQTAGQQPAVGYRGTVHFSSLGATRVQPELPADYTFVEGDEGRHTFDVTFYEATTQTLTASDAADARIAGSMNFTVQAGATAKVTLSGVPATVEAGAASALTVNVLDTNDNPIPGFLGSVALSSSDANAVLPASYSFLASENGSHTFPGVVLKTAGAQKLTARATLAGEEWSAEQLVAVVPAAVDHLAVSGIGTSIPLDYVQSVTVVAQDVYGNAAAGYRGRIHFSSQDGSTVPSDYTFAAPDNGAHTFADEVSFSKSGTFSVTAADTLQPSVRGVQSDIVVQAGAPTRLTATGIPSPVIAGTANRVRVTAVDKDGTTSPAYLDTVTLGSSDGRATFAPASHKFVAGDGGAFEFTVVFKTAGTQSVTATDVAHRTGSQANIAVAAAEVLALAVSGVQSPIAARATANLTVAAVDGFGNTNRNYRGTVRLTSSNSSAALPTPYTFTVGDSGAHTFTGIYFRKAGVQAITATDTAHASITGKQEPITVVPGAVASLDFSQMPSNAKVGSVLGDVQVKLVDQDDNLADNATAQVTLSLQTSPSGAALSGATPVAPSGGLATFRALSVDRAGTYTLRAAVGGISKVSKSFDATCATGYSGSDCKTCADGYKASTATQGSCVLVCAETNPCTSPPGDTCSGNTLARHSSPGSCSSSASAPFYECTYATIPVDCTTAVANGICFTDSTAAGRCISDPCLGVSCVDKTPDCEPDGVTRNTYVSSCAPTGEGAHACNQAKSSALCSDQVCLAGACSRSPAAGDLAISEVMHAPSATSVSRRWFELTNLSSSPLNLAGLIVDDEAGHSFSLPASPPALVDVGGRYVIGEAAASYVDAVGILGDFSMGASGALRLTAGATAVASLSWDETFPNTAGAAMNLSAKFVNPLAMLRSFHWCDAKAAMAGSGADLGTPGGANADCGTPGTTLLALHPVSGCKAVALASPSVAAGATVGPILGQVFEPNATDLSTVANDYYPFIEGQVGYGATGSDASSWTTWVKASWSTSYSPASSPYDELAASLVFPLVGQYAYGYRFRLIDDQDHQGDWGYCDSIGLVTASPPTSAYFPVVTVSP